MRVTNCDQESVAVRLSSHNFYRPACRPWPIQARSQGCDDGQFHIVRNAYHSPKFAGRSVSVCTRISKLSQRVHVCSELLDLEVPKSPIQWRWISGEIRPLASVGLAFREWQLTTAKWTSSGSGHMLAMCQNRNSRECGSESEDGATRPSDGSRFLAFTLVRANDTIC